jgi:hypothetical protein
MESWSTHRWIPPLGRVLEIKRQALRHFRCEACKRDFVEEMESAKRYAVNVGTFDFERLSDEVTERWGRTPCREYPPVDDAEDRRQLYPAEPPVSKGEVTSPVVASTSAPGLPGKLAPRPDHQEAK